MPILGVEGKQEADNIRQAGRAEQNRPKVSSSLGKINTRLPVSRGFLAKVTEEVRAAGFNSIDAPSQFTIEPGLGKAKLQTYTDGREYEDLFDTGGDPVEYDVHNYTAAVLPVHFYGWFQQNLADGLLTWMPDLRVDAQDMPGFLEDQFHELLEGDNSLNPGRETIRLELENSRRALQEEDAKLTIGMQAEPIENFVATGIHFLIIRNGEWEFIEGEEC